MNAMTENTPKLDLLKWLSVVVLIAAAIAGNIYFENQPAALRIAAMILIGLIIVGIAAFTDKGRQIIAFAQDSRIEMRKVVWPTRQETIQVTLLVVGIVIITALFLWGIDTVLLWLVQYITGQRG